MNPLIGEYGLAGGLLAAGVAVVAAVASVRFQSSSALKLVRTALAAQFALVSLSAYVLMRAMLDSDFRLAYVVSYSEKALPGGYKLAAFWAGQEGSLLLWAWLLALMGLVLAVQLRDARGIRPAVALGVMAVVGGFFAALMLFAQDKTGHPAANPFALLDHPPADGRGLNPLLQDPYMIAHPPLLFVGYAGYTAPFALLLGALAAGRSDNDWLAQTRRWMLVAWLFLSVGIILGAKWAYIELGWGGYWAWDPVENASLLPWLTGTALLHSIMVQQHKGMFKFWNAGLIVATFCLCIFGTYLTRSGVIQSVHAFPESMVGQFFLGLLIVSLVAGVAMMLLRRGLLKTEQPIEHLVSKEGAFMATNVLLVIITGITLVGTIMPILSSLFMKDPVTVKEPFYNSVVLPFGLLLMALMAIGPVLIYGKDAADKIRRGFIVPGSAAAVGVILTAAMGYTSPWALACVAVVVVAALMLGIETYKALRTQQQLQPRGLITALAHLVDGNHRRYGGQLVHVGMLMMVVGIAGSSLYGVNENFQIHRGETVVVGDYQIGYQGLEQKQFTNYQAVEADVTVTDNAGQTWSLLPQTRFYAKSMDRPHSQVALTSNLKRDIYITLHGWGDDGAHAALQVIISPLVAWIWIGGIVLTAGGLICVLPRFFAQPQRAGIALPLTTAGKATPCIND